MNGDIEHLMKCTTYPVLICKDITGQLHTDPSLLVTYKNGEVHKKLFFDLII